MEYFWDRRYNQIGEEDTEGGGLGLGIEPSTPNVALRFVPLRFGLPGDRRDVFF